VGETIKALVVLRPGQAATEAELIAHCRSYLAHFKAPRSVEIRDALARTATGKLQKFKLREPYWAGKAKRANRARSRPASTRSLCSAAGPEVRPNSRSPGAPTAKLRNARCRRPARPMS